MAHKIGEKINDNHFLEKEYIEQKESMQKNNFIPSEKIFIISNLFFMKKNTPLKEQILKDLSLVCSKSDDVIDVHGLNYKIISEFISYLFQEKIKNLPLEKNHFRLNVISGKGLHSDKSPLFFMRNLISEKIYQLNKYFQENKEIIGLNNYKFILRSECDLYNPGQIICFFIREQTKVPNIDYKSDSVSITPRLSNAAYIIPTSQKNPHSAG